MKTIQMTLDEDLAADVDEAARRLKTSRSAFAREALRQAIINLRTMELEEKHRRGYERALVATGEFSVWENEQEWGEK